MQGCNIIVLILHIISYHCLFSFLVQNADSNVFITDLQNVVENEEQSPVSHPQANTDVNSLHDIIIIIYITSI